MAHGQQSVNVGCQKDVVLTFPATLPQEHNKKQQTNGRPQCRKKLFCTLRLK
jgi:hypothetical protein